MSERVVVVRPTVCLPCLRGEHLCPSWPHTWGTVQDFEYAHRTGQPEPGNCACECGQWTPEQEAFMRPQIQKLLEGAEERRNRPAKPDDLDAIRRRIEAVEKEH